MGKILLKAQKVNMKEFYNTGVPGMFEMQWQRRHGLKLT